MSDILKRSDNTRIVIAFSECAHSGDEGNYIDDIHRCGGQVISSEHNFDEEVLKVVVKTRFELDEFRQKINATDSAGFIIYYGRRKE